MSALICKLPRTPLAPLPPASLRRSTTAPRHARRADAVGSKLAACRPRTTANEPCAPPLLLAASASMDGDPACKCAAVAPVRDDAAPLLPADLRAALAGETVTVTR